MDTPGTRQFGRYEIVEELGRGAMGVVYKARDPQIDRLVALKTVSVLGLEPEQEQEFRERFRYEAQAAGRLHHPSIVSIFDVGEDPETHESYIVLEYVVGESLSRILSRNKKLRFSAAIRLAEELAEALDYAHAQGVVHRDIKPANILVTEDGRAKITDFGIAKLNLAHFTLPGKILGTPAYMAPEQLSGEGVDGRSDLFSLGVILYSMVTGHSPFPGSSATTVCFKVVNREPVPASSFDLELPRSLDAVISRAMAKNPADRYQRGSELAADLRQLREQFKTGLTTTSWIAAPTARSGTRNALASPAAAESGILWSKNLVRTAVSKATIRDLILAAAAVIALIIIAIPPRQQLAPSQKVPSATAVPVSAAPVSSAQPNGAPFAATVPDTSPAAPNSAPKGPSAAKAEAVKPKQPSARRAPKEAIVPSATLELSVQHQFKDATLWLWVDDKLALTRPLHGGTQKRMVLFTGIRGIGSETIKVPAGTHVLHLRTQTADQSIDLSKTISGTFVSGDVKTLQITFDKHNTAIRLNWQ